MGGDAMYPKKRPKTDREKFYEAFGKKVGCKPEQPTKVNRVSPASRAAMNFFIVLHFLS